MLPFSWLTEASATGEALAAAASSPVVPGPASFQLLLFSAVPRGISLSECRNQAIMFKKGVYGDLTERSYNKKKPKAGQQIRFSTVP